MEKNDSTPRRLRGSASIAPDGSFDFRPQQPSEERRTLVRKTKNGSALYRTAVNNRLTAHLTAPQDTPDPEAWMAREMNELLAAQGSKARVKERGYVVAKTERTELRLDTRAGALRASITLPLAGIDVVPNLAAQTAVLLSYASVNRHEIDREAARVEKRAKAQAAQLARKEAHDD